MAGEYHGYCHHCEMEGDGPECHRCNNPIEWCTWCEGVGEVGYIDGEITSKECAIENWRHPRTAARITYGPCPECPLGEEEEEVA